MESPVPVMESAEPMTYEVVPQDAVPVQVTDDVATPYTPAAPLDTKRLLDAG